MARTVDKVGVVGLGTMGSGIAQLCIQAGVPTIFHEAKGNIHGFMNLRKAIPSS